MTTAKQNYTDEQVQELVTAYTAAGDSTNEAGYEARDKVVSEFAEKFGKHVRSIRSKLVAEKVYIKKAAVSKVTGGEAMKKDAMAEKLIHVSGLNLNAESVAKMNKTDIQALIDAFELTDEEAAEVNSEETE